MSSLLTRALTGLIFVTVVLGSIILNEYAAAGVMGLFMLLGLFEFYGLFRQNESISVDRETNTFVGTFVFGLFTCIVFNVIPEILSVLTFPLLFSLILIELWRKKQNPILNIGVSLLGLFYIVVPFFLMIILNRYDHLFSWSEYSGQFLPLLGSMFILVWTNDTFAYLTGRLIGKTKLIERISPNKTWEGTIGGIVLTSTVGLLLSLYSPIEDTLFWMIGAAIVASSAILGDLLESLFKRSLNIKDSGSILPGHGGILDRFDAAIFSIPFFSAWVILYSFFFR